MNFFKMRGIETKEHVEISLAIQTEMTEISLSFSLSTKKYFNYFNILYML